MPSTGSSPLLNVSGVDAPVRMIVVGVGNAGSHSVARMAETWRVGPDVAVINTDRKDLACCAVATALAIGPKSTKGFGAGGDTVGGRLAAEENLGEIQELVSGFDLVVLVGGLGGGTATGALPLIASAARAANAVTICFVTMPFAFEGEKRKLAAEEGLRNLAQQADAIVCVPNDELQEIVDLQQPVEVAFRAVDDVVASGLHAIWRMLTGTGVVNLNFGDLRELVDRSGGLCGFGHAEATGAARSAEVIQNLAQSPLLAKGRRISEAQAIMVSILGGQDLSLGDLQGIMGQIKAMARPSARILFGAIVDPAWRDRVSITVLASEHWRGERVAVAAKAGKTTAGEPGDETLADTVDDQPTLFPIDKGPNRFDKVPPTYHGGEDLDIPTYFRRGRKLSFEL